MKFWKIALSAVLAVTLFGCASKYQAPQNISTPANGLTKSQVKSAILASATQDQTASSIWKMKAIDNNTIQAALFNRGYEVVVNIPYSEKGYEINYVSVSNNLLNKDGNVHRNYNRWINNLDVKIKENLFLTK